MIPFLIDAPDTEPVTVTVDAGRKAREGSSAFSVLRSRLAPGRVIQFTVPFRSTDRCGCFRLRRSRHVFAAV
jgi:hypothetical protein